MQKKIKNPGFTLVEVTITMLIVATIAVIALPKLNFAVEEMRAKEGEQFLHSILMAQKRYAIEHDDLDPNTLDYASDIADLDVDFSANPPDNFQQPVLVTGLDPLIASITRNGGVGYRLYILSDGTFQCEDLVHVGPDKCAKMGYTIYWPF